MSVPAPLIASFKYVALALVASALAVALAAAVRDASWWMVSAALVGWYAADAASGLVHMTLDYRACPPGRGLDRLYTYAGSRESAEYLTMRARTMASLSPLDRLTYEFKNHHPRPDALGRRDLWRQIGSTVFAATLPLSLALAAASLALPVPGWLITGLVVLLTGATFSQYFHGTLHRADNPAIVRAMRGLGLLMTPAAHQRHHETLRRDFATISGWSNPPLNLLFDALRARGLLSDAGLHPHR